MMYKKLSRFPNVWTAGILALLCAGIALAQPSPAEKLYREGQDALAEGRYPAAVEHFRALGDEPDAQADRALYWLAYAEGKAGRRAAALSTLTRFTEQYPQSPWFDDARALQLELGGIGPERAAAAGEDDLKLYALDALMQADPERAVDLLETFLAGNPSNRLQQRALFVLSQTSSPRAGKMLTAFARDASKKDLQHQAIQALGISGDTTAIAELKTIYRASNDAETKRKILHSLIASSAADATAELAIAETDPELRSQALHTLAAMGATEQLAALAKELGPEHRGDIYRAYGIAGDTEPLMRAIRENRDPEAMAEAIQALAITGIDRETRDVLLEAYRTRDASVKESVLQAFMIGGDSKALLEIFRSEEDPEMKAQALRMLSIVGGPEVDSLIEKLLED